MADFSNRKSIRLTGVPNAGPIDVAVPLAFPDYKIHVDFQVPSANLPVLGRVGGQKVTATVPLLGHAGILFINSKGTSKYYEYGRYPPSGAHGRVRNHRIPDAVIGPDSHATMDSLTKILTAVSTLAGQGGRIDGAYVVVPGSTRRCFSTFSVARFKTVIPSDWRTI